MNTRLMKVYEDLTFKSSLENNVKRENANIDGDTAMGTMLKYGSEGAKQFYEMFILDPEHARAHREQFYEMFILDPEHARAHREGDIHIHDLDFLTLTTTCCQIDLLKLFQGGFSTGHGFLREPNDIRSYSALACIFLREPNDIRSYSALACIALQSNQNDQHGGQSIPNFDYSMAPGVKKTFRRAFTDNLTKAIEVYLEQEDGELLSKSIVKNAERETGEIAVFADGNGFDEAVERLLCDHTDERTAAKIMRFTRKYAVKDERETGEIAVFADGNGFDEAVERLLCDHTDERTAAKIMRFTRKYAVKETRRNTYQAMEALVHNLNTMHSRAGAQVPFTSLNYGTDTSPEGRLVMECLMKATEAGLGNGETSIFPIHIFKVKEGVTSLNYGTDTSPEGRLVMECLMKATEAGLGNGETSIFPIHIFKVKEGVNYNPGEPNYDLFKLAMRVSAKRMFPNFSFLDAPFNAQYYNYNPGEPNYDLFKLAMRVSAKRMFPNFSFLDAPFNAQYYKPGHPETEATYMGCRTRVVGNVFDPTREIVNGRGNLSFTSINLPRIAILSKGDIDWFFEDLDRKIDLVIDQLLARLRIQSQKKVRNYPFLMGQGVWIDSEKLGPDDSVGEVLKHGSLTCGFIGLAETLKALIGVHHGESDEAQELGLKIVSHMRERMDQKHGSLTCGFIGLAETLKALIGVHHGESDEAQELGLKIVSHMRERMDQAAQQYHLNFTLIATPAEGLSGRFVRMDRARFGEIPGVTDREYYTNSFHVPVYYPISAFEKIRREAPYHALTNGGHISYIELDGESSTAIRPRTLRRLRRSSAP